MAQLDRNESKRGDLGRAERWASLLGGTALTAWALKSRSKGAIGLAALAGAPLLYRGARAHCPIKERVERKLDERHREQQPLELPLRETSPERPESVGTLGTPSGTPGAGPEAGPTGRRPIGQTF